MPDKKVTPLQSLCAGVVAGAVESAVTYPTEFVKTQLQLQGKILKTAASAAASQTKIYKGPIDVVISTVKERGVTGLYRGLSAMLIGTSVKAGVRFLVFDSIKAALADDKGKVTGARMVLAGLGAGAVEAVVAVTPTETIKTKLIQDQNMAKPKYRGLVHGTRMIIAEQGLSGIYQGVTSVVARQGANSAVRLSSYGLLREKLQEHYKNTSAVPWYATFGIGSFAGIITVYSTMPIDVVKTKMQSLEAKTKYKHSIDCFLQTLRSEGVFALWKGATPRLGRLIFSGGIVFTVYEEVVGVMKLWSK